MPVRMYSAHAPPMDAKMTEVVRKWLLSAISLRMENIWTRVRSSWIDLRRDVVKFDMVSKGTYILVACVCKDNDGEGGKHGDWTSPSKDAHVTSLGQSVAFDEMCNN